MASMRGKILKTPDVTPGLLFVNGQQKSFAINGVWKSADVAPAVQMTVDVELGDDGAIVAVSPVSDADIAREQAKEVVGAVGEKSKQLAGLVVARVGKSTLIVLALLIGSWFFLDYYSVKFSALFVNVTIHPTFWRQVGYLNVVQGDLDDLDDLMQLVGDVNRYSGPHSDMPPTGFYGVLGIAALLGPLLPVAWKDKRACLGLTLPLLFTLLIVVQNIRATYAIRDAARETITRTIGGIQSLDGALGGGAQATTQVDPSVQKAIDEQTEQFRKQLHWSLGLGFYLSTASVLCLAWVGGMKFLEPKRRTS